MNEDWNIANRWKVAPPSSVTATLCVSICFLLPMLRATSLHAQQVADGYADPASCISCHAAIDASYKKTGMGRSLHPIGTSDPVEVHTNQNGLYNKASDRFYRIAKRNGAYFEQRFQVGFEGKESNREEFQIDYVVGSGNHARTFLHRTTEGKLIELPVSWYSEKGGYWEMSPGYDEAHQQDFRRAIPYECIACHNGYPTNVPAFYSGVDKDIFGPNLPEGIDCQRCHGPGAAHVEAVEGGESDKKIRAAILNPARLDRDRQMEVCMQCHLETTSWPLPHSIRRFEHTASPYHPGEPLENHELAFDHKPGSGFDDKFQVVSQVYRLRKSACFQKSQMTCITCHDPHTQLRGDAATSHYIAVCTGCHNQVHQNGAPGEDKRTEGDLKSQEDCLTCHMWKRRTDDAVHVVMTDHYIQRAKPETDMLAMPKNVPAYYRGEVVPYYPNSLAKVPNGDLYLAIAQIEDGANLERGANQLKDGIARLRPADAEFYFAMGTADSKLGRDEEAVQWYEEALRRRPNDQRVLRSMAATFEAMGDLQRASAVGEKAAQVDHPDTLVLTNLGRVYMNSGRLNDAKRVLEQALTINPVLPDSALLLGMVLIREGDVAGAESQYRNAIDIQPDYAEAHNNLAGILARRGGDLEARYEFDRAVQCDPENSQIRLNYSIFLSHTGALDRALDEAKKAVELAPKAVKLHVNLGDVNRKRGDGPSAEREYRAALALNVQDGEANLRLAELLETKGESVAARIYFLEAAKSTDPKIRQLALKALQR